MQHTLKDIIKKLWKETGTNSISSKRWKDYFFIERELFLLRKLEVVVRKKAPEYESKIETA